ncbi:cell wall biosynthesis glycosyltransferase [Caulobacter segnis]|uniref:Glycosyltransferase involved in cell wall biogenesis n=2 Tax=Caulobacter segnis TaxID=88688 RepID=D5VJ24_CAUST|nr:hypothetical protein [Caulobacter segnis]ADG10112.1 glycosyltransferase involved in cell wall biogenesis [Caulobacter segnis ATCC 21756]AVQ01861.1 cell wall biosynthesis glycosyltransferase [Caulobacter segnis]
MISVVLLASDDLQGLAAQMAMLVPAAVDGLVKEVLLAGVSEPGVEALVEDSGARLVQVEGDAAACFAAAAAAARGDWILTLRAAPALREGWREPVEKHLAGAGGTPAALAAPGGWLTRRLHGVLVRRLDWPTSAGDERALAKTLKARRLAY